MLSRAEVIRAEFGRGRRGQNYDELEVDDFLDRLAATLGSYESGDAAGTGESEPVVTARELDDVTFASARGFGRAGYDTDAVDTLLRQARETLRVYESRPPGVGAASHRAEQPSVITPSAVTRPEGGLFSRLFKR